MSAKYLDSAPCSSSSSAAFFKKVDCHGSPLLPILSQSHDYVFISHSPPFFDICHPLRSWLSSSYFPLRWTVLYQHQPVDVVTSDHARSAKNMWHATTHVKVWLASLPPTVTLCQYTETHLPTIVSMHWCYIPTDKYRFWVAVCVYVCMYRVRGGFPLSQKSL